MNQSAPTVITLQNRSHSQAPAAQAKTAESQTSITLLLLSPIELATLRKKLINHFKKSRTQYKAQELLVSERAVAILTYFLASLQGG